MNRRNVKYALAGAIALLTFIVYLASLQNEFVEWDDSQYVFENLHIRSFDLAFFRWAFFDFYAANWHPLTWMSHALDYAVWGLNPLGHHLTNNILHAVNTFLVVLLVARLIESTNPESQLPSPQSPVTIHNSRFKLIAAGVTGLLFGLHPIHVESVAWVAERKDLLCALFYLLSVLAYAGYVCRGNPAWLPFFGRPHRAAPTRTYILSLIFFILALLSKPMAVTLPFVLLILDWYPFRRTTSLKAFRISFVEKIPFIALSIGSSILTIMAQKAAEAIRSGDVTPVLSRVLVAANSLIAYLWMMLAPLKLLPLYTYPRDISLLSSGYLLPVLLAAGITAACVLMAKKQRALLSAWGYYVVSLIPVIGIVQVGGQAMADRYTYLPGLGPFLVIGLAAAWTWEKLSAQGKRKILYKLAGASAVVLVSVCLINSTTHQIAIWKNNVALWSYVIEKEPEKVNFAYYMRGLAYQGQGRLDEAVADFNMAIALEPFHFEVYFNRGSILEKMGQPDNALEDYSMAIAINPRAAEAHISRGILYGKTGLFEKAIGDFNKAIDVNPNYPPAYFNRGTAYSCTGQNNRALDDLNKAIALDQNYAKAYFNRGNLYLAAGNKELAIPDLQRACDLGDKEGCNALLTATLPTMNQGR